MPHDEKPTSNSADILALDPIWIPGQIDDLKTEGADYGVNRLMIHDNEGGLLITLLAYPNMQEGDWIDVFWGDDDSTVTNGRVESDQVGQNFSLYVAPDRVPEGIHDLHAEVTRAGGGNGGVSPPLAILVRTEIPGGIDPEPDVPNHQDLQPPGADLPPGGVIDDDAAKAGIEVTIPGYLNMRLYDKVFLSWGGVLVSQEVTQADLDANQLVIRVTEEVIRQAGDSDQLVLVYRIRDEVHNPSDGWSMRTLVTVEIGEGLFDAPVIQNPDPDADPVDIIDLDKLGEDDLLVSVMVLSGGALQRNDELTLNWVGTTSQGESHPVELGPERINQVPGFVNFSVPNAALRNLGQGRGAAFYTASRAGAELGRSKRTFVEFTGVEYRLPKPIVQDAIGDTLDPTLSETTVIIPGEVLEANDTVFLTWHGIQANGTPLVKTEQRGVSEGAAGQPMLFTIEAEYIAPLDGGSVSVHYRLHKDSSDTELDSDRERLRVGEVSFELPAPTTRPAAVEGVLDPDGLPVQLQLVVPPWPSMLEGQTVHILWRASNGPDHADEIQIRPPTVGHEVLFPMDRQQVEGYLGQEIGLSYRIEDPHAETRYSDTAWFSIGPLEAPLPLPEITEADGGEIDPDQVLDGATVHIAASAGFEDNDQLLVKVVGASADGSIEIPHEIAPGSAGQPVNLPLPWAVINANAGATFDLYYEITRAADGRVERSDTVTFSVVVEVGSGPLRIMGARFNHGNWRASAAPRMLQALDDRTLLPVRAEWRYEGEPAWVVATHWEDTKPWLKLHVRNRSETWECAALNIFGTGHTMLNSIYGAFLALRDEIVSDGEPKVDMVAWGHGEYGGYFKGDLSSLTNVVDAHATVGAFAARLRDGHVVCWGHPGAGGSSPPAQGNFNLLRGNGHLFVARETGGELHAWGQHLAGMPVPDEVNEHRDYVEFCGSRGATAALRTSGHVKVWRDKNQGGELHPGQDELDGIIRINSNRQAFVALRKKSDVQSVIAWGNADYGGDLDAEIAGLTNVRSLGASTLQAFCILLTTGELKAWPATTLAGRLPDDIARLRNVREVSATSFAFCARLDNGKVAAWGHEGYGGKLTDEVAGRSDIVQVTGNEKAFVALCADGTVVTWGDHAYGGYSKHLSDELVEVCAVYANGAAFVALTRDRRVVTWGVGQAGGDSDGVQAKLNGRVSARRLLSAGEAQAVAREVNAGS